MTVQILRFRDGLDVISHVMYKNDIGDKQTGEIELTNPMIFEVQDMNLIMQNWLPLGVMKGKSVTINKQELICTFEPNEDFAEYYTTTVQKMNKALRESKDEVNKEELAAALEELETIKGLKIH